jgi:hypothetical protein
MKIQVFQVNSGGLLITDSFLITVSLHYLITRHNHLEYDMPGRCQAGGIR